VKNEWPNGNSKLSHLSKWWKRNGQMGTVNWVTWANSEKIFCSHLAIHFSLFTQVTQFPVPIWPFVFHHLLRWLNLLFHLAIHFSPLAQVTQFTAPIWSFIFHYLLKWLNLLFPFDHSFFTTCSSDSIYCSHLAIPFLSKWRKRNGQMGTVNWDTWANSEKGMAKWEQ
jgi:hypothetical protein